MSNRFAAVAVPGMILLTLVLPAPGEEKKLASKLDKMEAKKAFEYLNKVRQAPDKFSKEIGADLSEIKARSELAWDEKLVGVAEEKALDMAERNYVGHVNPDGIGINIQIHEAGYKLPEEWIKEKKMNFFESIAAGDQSGPAAIRMLILDKGVATLGHRKHLLGMGEFYAECTDIGIGCARNPKSRFRTYMCVIIAKQK